jgi:hypothetical protein
MKDFKEALGIENARWTGIGEHIAKITGQKLREQNKTSIDLTNRLREVGHKYIEPEYVDEYLCGKTSFGCFFTRFRDYLDIKPLDVFPKASEEEAKVHLAALDNYLLETDNLDSLEIFLKHKPGEELRNHVAQTLTKKRDETLKKTLLFN